MPDEFFTRATIVKARVDRLAREGRSIAASGDVSRMEAIGAEMELAVRALEDIREEQLIASLPKPKTPKRRWWRRRAIACSEERKP